MTDEDKINQIWFHVGKITTNIETMKDDLEVVKTDVGLLKQEALIRSTTRRNIVSFGKLIKFSIPAIMTGVGVIIGKGIFW